MSNHREPQPILVTGGAGYVGSHACKALAAAGYLPITLDNLCCGHAWAVKWGPLVQGDIGDRAILDAVMTEYQPVAVMHFAAYAYVGESVTNPGKYYRNNVAGTLSLLEAMRDHGVKRMVFSSTCATYGNPTTETIAEDHPQHPINPYGASKLMIEQMLRDFDTAHQMRSVSLRYFNAAGADAHAEIGEAHNPETHLIPLVLDAAAGRLPEVTIFGDQHGTSDGTCIRDYVHVEDLAQGHVLALQSLEAGTATCAYNLSNGIGFSVRQVIDTAQAVTGLHVPVRMGPARAGDPPRLVGDASRVRQTLGWAPRYTRLEDIIASAWAWHQTVNHIGV